MLKIVLPLIATAAALLAACTVPIPETNFIRVTGSGSPVTQTYEFSDFTGLDISNAFQAEIVQGETYAVEVTVDDNLVEHLKVEQRGDTVHIGLKPNLTLSRTSQAARVTLPTLTHISASGAVAANLSGFSSAKNLRVDVSGASRVEGEITAGDLRAEVSGGSRLLLAGSGGDADITASGASVVELSDFAVNDAEADASGASRIMLNAGGTLRADASGASAIRYRGNPTVDRSNTSGASTIGPQ